MRFTPDYPSMMHTMLPLVLVLLVFAPVSAQRGTDFSGQWILESVTPATADVSRTLLIRQRLVRTNVRGEPMTPFYQDLTVTRETPEGTRTDKHSLGVIGGTVAGQSGKPNGHHRTAWQDATLVFESGTYTGRRPQTGEWTERHETWALDAQGRLTVTTTTTTSRDGTTTVTAVYRRQ